MRNEIKVFKKRNADKIVELNKNRLDSKLRVFKDFESFFFANNRKVFCLTQRRARKLNLRKPLSKPKQTILPKEIFHNDGIIRAKAAKAIKESGNADKIEALRRLLKGRKMWRFYAVEALGRIEDRDSVPAIERTLFKEDNRGIRLAAVYALSNILKNQAIPILERAATREPDSTVRGAIVKCLDSFKDKKAIPALEKLSKDNAVLVKFWAEQALNALDKKPTQ